MGGPDAGPRLVGVRDADVDVAVLVDREAVGAGEHPEVMVEGPILLHDHDDVLDLLEPAVLRTRGGSGPGGRRSQHRGHDRQRGGHDDPGVGARAGHGILSVGRPVAGA
jgi:hypothetical protein